MSRSRRLVPSSMEVEIRGNRVKHDMKKRAIRLSRRSTKQMLASICTGCGLNLDHCMCQERRDYASNPAD